MISWGGERGGYMEGIGGEGETEVRWRMGSQTQEGGERGGGVEDRGWQTRG